MAYSGQQVVIQFQNPGSLTNVASSVIDLSASTADYATIIVPIPLIIYSFGFYSHESAAAAITGAALLEVQRVVAASQVTIVSMNFDATDQASGGDRTAGVTAAAGSESVDAGDITYAPSSVFPYLVDAPNTLMVSLTQTAQVGEFTPFIVGRWLGLDYRSDGVWAS